MRSKIILILLFVPLIGLSQSGPGGVGTTDGSSNLSLWLDAGTITGLSDGANVTSWADASGNGLTAVSSGIAAEEPIFDANSVNTSFASISFDGSDYLNLGAPASLDFIPGTDSWSFFIVYNVPDPTPQGTFFAKASGTSSTRQYQYTIDDIGTSRFTSYIGGSGVVGSIASSGDWYVSSHTNNTTNRDSWTNEGNNFVNLGIGTNLVAGIDVLIGARRQNNDNTGTGFQLTGSIAEIAMYDVEVTAVQRIIVTNYLAAKYDLTLTANDVYDQDDVANGNYDFDVAGIGQDSGGSNNLDAQGTGIVRILNPTDLGNDEFLIWGHDNGSEFPIETTDVPAGGDPVAARFDRVWRVSEANAGGTGVDVGSIDIRWDLTGKGPVTPSDLRLLVDTDNDGTFADETPISGATNASGNIYEFSGVSAIVDNYRFTLGTVNSTQTPLMESPGGVIPNLTLWLTDEGTSTTTDGIGILSWTDQSGFGNDVAQATGSSRPLFKNNSSDNLNYNPVLDFDGTDDVLTDASGILGAAAYTDLNVYSVVITDVVSNSFLFEERCTPNRLSVTVPWGDGTFYWDAGDFTGNYRLSTAWGGTAGEPYLWSMLYSTTSGQTVAGVRQVINRNGQSIATDNTASSFTGTSTQFNLGRGIAGNPYAAKIAEFVVYTGSIDATQHNKIESFLGIKYGITLSNAAGGTAGDYTATDGTTIWDASIGSGYHNDVIGIGRDDTEGLYQKQSQTSYDSLRVFIDALATDNDSNSGTITNDISYLVIGHNGGRQRGQWPESPAGITRRLSREWKITNTNFTDNFSLEIEWDSTEAFDINHIRLLVDADGDFSDATVLSTADGLTFSVGSIIVGGISNAHIPAGSTRFVTIGSANAATPLPIELIHFSATVADGSVINFEWQTASETDNDFFTIERSTDGLTWEDILDIDGAGNSSLPLDYSAVDENPYHGISYYRLKQTDFDGQYAYSKVKSVVIDVLQESRVVIYPNPATNEITIQGEEGELSEISIYNLLGEDVTGFTEINNSNRTSVQIDLSRLRTGLYMVKTRTATNKVYKQ